MGEISTGDGERDAAGPTVRSHLDTVLFVIVSLLIVLIIDRLATGAFDWCACTPTIMARWSRRLLLSEILIN